MDYFEEMFQLSFGRSISILYGILFKVGYDDWFLWRAVQARGRPEKGGFFGQNLPWHNSSWNGPYMLWNTHYLKSSIFKINIVSAYMGEGKAQLRKLHNFFRVGHWKSRYAKYWQYLCVYFCIRIIREKWWKRICALEGRRLTTGTQLSSSSYRFTTFLWHLPPTIASSECF